MKKLVRSLSPEGRVRFGHIFKAGYIPVKQITPIWANLQGHPDGAEQLVFLVDWTRLSTEQQTLVLDYLSEKFIDARPSEIHRQFEADGYFPIQHKWVIESYDLRHFI
ncbi:hypothetical protein C6503_19455 [Candidatus Poribacteria bacterium]|nr:MAG: hypothetical protein C6503_19455 [Candidatus Poribacteria bacterium]